MARSGQRALQDAITAVCNGQLDSLALGKWLGENKGRPADGLLFSGRKDRKRVMVWSISSLNASAPQPSAPPPANEEEALDAAETAAVVDQEHAQRIAEAISVFAAS